MQLLLALPFLAAAAISSVQAQHDVFAVLPADVEHQDVVTSPLYTAIAITSVSHNNNYVNNAIQRICVTDVTRVREAVFNGTRDILLEVNGCSVAKPQGACSSSCQNVPFELHVAGKEKTAFNPLAVVLAGKPVQSPYKVQSVGGLL